MPLSIKKKLTFHYLAALGFIALLTLLNYYITHQLLLNKGNDARVVNISGQLGTLSQKMTKLVLLLERTDTLRTFQAHQNELEETFKLWQQFHLGLRGGDVTLGLSGKNNAQIELYFNEVQPHYQALIEAVDEVTGMLPTMDSLMRANLATEIEKILLHEEKYLNVIRNITLSYDKEVSNQIQYTREVELYLMVFMLLVLLLEGIFIFYPSVEMAARHVEEINYRKTELEEANQELRKAEEINQLKNEELLANEEEIRQNLEELETINEALLSTSEELRRKNEVLREAKEVLDIKNKQIRSNRDQLYQQSKQLEETNKNITNSIRYAKRIQQAIIPAPEVITQKFREAFIFFKPKDIVSGDFYWFHEVGSKKILIAADCTGHGVPGALMTMIGNSLLNEIIASQGIQSPSEILLELDRKIVEMLQKRTGDGKPIHDGMDMAVLAVDENTREVQFAAAHNPLYYIRKGEMHRVKGSRFPVGSSQYKSDKVFELHCITAEEGDIFYIFTDGFQDQYGEKAKRKYMSKRFRQFMTEISQQPMAHQRIALSQEFADWKGNSPQTDDILIIGVKM